VTAGARQKIGYQCGQLGV